MSEGELAGFAAYLQTDDLIVFRHTVIDPRFEGKGMGSELVHQALDDVRSRPSAAVMPVRPAVDEPASEYHNLDYRRPESRVSD